MSFVKQLEHLRHAAYGHGRSSDTLMIHVRRQALVELLHHFDRLAGDARDTHATDRREEYPTLTQWERIMTERFGGGSPRE